VHELVGKFIVEKNENINTNKKKFVSKSKNTGSAPFHGISLFDFFSENRVSTSNNIDK
jgi:hypothetical protein